MTALSTPGRQAQATRPDPRGRRQQARPQEPRAPDDEPRTRGAGGTGRRRRPPRRTPHARSPLPCHARPTPMRMTALSAPGRQAEATRPALAAADSKHAPQEPPAPSP